MRLPRSNRPGFSVFLILAGIVLLASIAVGNRMGDRVLGQITTRGSTLPTPVPIVTEASNDANGPAATNWKKKQIVVVATDPAFPDPRVTPPPLPTPTPYKPPPSPKATRTPVPTPAAEETTHAPYTSPPLLNASPPPGGQETPPVPPSEVSPSPGVRAPSAPRTPTAGAFTLAPRPTVTLGTP